MFGGLWPDIPTHEVPIRSITNGVHAHTWVGDQVDALLRRSVGGVWDGADAAAWARVHDLADADVWGARRVGRAALVEFVRSHLGDDVLDPEALTIGFARRFATYKRATLLLSQPDRLRELLRSADRPVQFVFAGKAHPADHPGKEMIRDIERFARHLDVAHRFVFVPDYDMAVARMMYQGCDVWLNNPRRPLEACGTSGMKAALNGALNCSIRDGWWDECFDGSNGWAIVSADDDPDPTRRDAREGAHLFALLEREIVPLFHDRDQGGIPVGWARMVKHNWASLGPFVTAARMVRDYTSGMYEPAAASARAVTADGWARARDLVSWKRHVAEAWSTVAIVDVDAGHGEAAPGELRCVRARLDLGRLGPHDVTVELLHGPTDTGGALAPTAEVVTMRGVGDSVWEADCRPTAAGPYGLTVRVLPRHDGLLSPVELGRAMWAG